MLTKDEVIAVAKQVHDPEIPVDIWELGLIYDIHLHPESESVSIKMSLTSQNCPAAGSIPEDLKFKLLGTGKVKDAQVEVVFEPPWSPERISEAGKKKLGLTDEGPPDSAS